MQIPLPDEKRDGPPRGARAKARRIGEEAVIPVVKRRVSGKVERLRGCRRGHSKANGAKWGRKGKQEVSVS